MRRKASIIGLELAYRCHFQPEPEGGYTVTCPSLPPVVTFGETLDVARANAREAIELCLEVMEAEGQPIPPADRAPGVAFDELVAIDIVGR